MNPTKVLNHQSHPVHLLTGVSQNEEIHWAVLTAATLRMRLAYAADSVAGRAGAGAGAAQGRALGRRVAGAVPAARSGVASLILQEEMT